MPTDTIICKLSQRDGGIDTNILMIGKTYWMRCFLYVKTINGCKESVPTPIIDKTVHFLKDGILFKDDLTDTIGKATRSWIPVATDFGKHILSAKFDGDTSYNPSEILPINFTVVCEPLSTTITIV